MNTINANELQAMMQQADNLVVLDVLPEESYEQEHIPGAHSLPVNDKNFTRRVEELAPHAGTPVAVYCADHECGLSPKAADTLEEHGYERVYDFAGGLDEWKKAGFDVA